MLNDLGKAALEGRSRLGDSNKVLYGYTTSHERLIRASDERGRMKSGVIIESTGLLFSEL